MHSSTFSKEYPNILKKKNNLYLMYVVSTKNNTVVTVKDSLTQKSLFVLTAGGSCLRGEVSRGHRNSTEALKILGSEVFTLLKKHKIVSLNIYFKGPSSFRRSFVSEFLKENDFSVYFFGDITQTPYNGCRSRKKKRTRSKRKPSLVTKR